MSPQVQRLAVREFTPLTPVNLAELHDMLALGGVQVDSEDLETAALGAEARERSLEPWGSPTATNKRLGACWPLVAGAKFTDERVDRAVAEEFRLIRAYHQDLRRPLAYDLGDAPATAEQAFHRLFRCIHDFCQRRSETRQIPPI